MTKQTLLFDPAAIRLDSLPALREREYLACRAYLRELVRYCRRPSPPQFKALGRQRRVWRDHCCNLPVPEHKDRTQIGLRRAEAIKRRIYHQLAAT